MSGIGHKRDGLPPRVNCNSNSLMDGLEIESLVVLLMSYFYEPFCYWPQAYIFYSQKGKIMWYYLRYYLLL